MSFRRIFLFCFFILIVAKIFSQNDKTLIYENYLPKLKMKPGQYLSRIILYPDSTYVWNNYQGTKSDSKENFKDWDFTSTNGIWYFEGKSLILKQGDRIGRYKFYKNYIKWRRIQYGHDGGKVIRYKKWIFEKRAKYKLVH